MLPVSYNRAMDAELEKRLVAIETKLDAVYQSAEKTRKYLYWTFIISVVVVVLPMIGLVFALPSFLSYYGDINSLMNSGGF
jgi:type IV secretory pathway component VirB8